MFGISMWEMGLIILVGLIFLGPRQLTETARAVGKLFREIQRMAVDVKDSIDLDAPPRKPPTYDPTHTPLPKPAAQSNDREPLGMPGEKSGPDFYAELLENSVEDEPKDEKNVVKTDPVAEFKTAGAISETDKSSQKPDKA